MLKPLLRYIRSYQITFKMSLNRFMIMTDKYTQMSTILTLMSSSHQSESLIARNQKKRFPVWKMMSITRKPLKMNTWLETQNTTMMHCLNTKNYTTKKKEHKIHPKIATTMKILILIIKIVISRSGRFVVMIHMVNILIFRARL